MAVIGSMAAILIHEPAKFHDLYALSLIHI